ncbi:nucleotidyltransferase family protein [Sulfitobacter sp. JB4-11]|uniref:nucleotidyltransferase family protein n=1 Tax=Sulfitobacter rhodophyticola TaxID=3238304 RepID=UPI003514B907
MADNPFPVMLFAAGFGTRMKALTQDKPKPMIEVAGRPMIDHALGLAEQAGATRLVANLHYRPDDLRRHLEPRGVVCVIETPDILETGGGLRNALPTLGAGPVMTMNTDAIWAGPNPLTLLQAAWRPDEMDALLMGISPANAVGHQGDGDFTRDADGLLRRGPGLIYGGVQIIKTDLLAQIDARAFSLNLLWDRMLAASRLHGLEYPGRWCDVGHPDGIGMAERLLEGEDV